MKRTVVFVISAVEEEGLGRAPFFHNTAFYLLRSYLTRCEDVRDDWDFQIIEFMPPGSTSTSFLDRSYEAVFHSIQRHQPAIVAFSLYVWNVTACHQLAAMIHQLVPGVKVLAGGPEVARREQFVEAYPEFDIVVENDGELPMRRILVALQKGEPLAGIANVSWRGEDGAFVHNPLRPEVEDINALPNFYADVPEKLRGQAFFLTARGCCNHCTYCLWAKQGLRQRSNEKMLQELETIAASRCDHIVFWDYDLLELYLQRPDVLDAMCAILAKNPKMTVEFFVNAGLLPHPALSELMKRMNVVRVNVGLQSGHPEALRMAGRAWTIASIDALFQAPDELKPYLVIEMMYPLPGETLQSYLQMLERLIRAGYFRFQIFPLMLLRGSALQRSAEQLGLRYTKYAPYHCFETPTVTRNERQAMAAVAFVLTSLAEAPVRFSGQRKVQQWIVGHPELPSTLSRRAMEGIELDELLGEVLEQIFGEAGRSVYAGAHQIARFYEALDTAADQEPAARKPSVAQFPATNVLRAALHRAGIELVAAELEGSELHLQCTAAGQPFELFLLPGYVDAPCFASTERYKLGYNGELPDPRVMPRFVQCIAAIERLGK